jgi:hypothetical protein
MTTPSPRSPLLPQSTPFLLAHLMRLSLALGIALVLHWVALTWLLANMPRLRPLASMQEPMFTRLLEPALPPAIVPSTAAPAAPAKAVRKRHVEARTVATSAAAAAVAEPASPPEPDVAVDAPTSAQQGEPIATIPPLEPTPTGAPESEPSSPAPPQTALPASTAPVDNPTLPGSPSAKSVDPWPPDTRLSYRLGGYYRGELNGSARVQWQRETAPRSSAPNSEVFPATATPPVTPSTTPPTTSPATSLATSPTTSLVASVAAAAANSQPLEPAVSRVNYQVALTVKAAGLTLATLTSQGEATATGLLPRVYEEQVPGGLRRAEFNDGQVKFQNGNVALLPAGAQDTVSQFVELAQRFSSGRERLAAGAQVRVWLARPGGLDEWIYDVGDEETLQTPELGAIQAFHLTPRPLANPRGAITAELWFAPSLQYLPVRVRIVLGGGDFVDLMIEKIEQAEAAPAAK